ncbi:hypothetical protein MINTMi27_15470 [Mycobacterium intracellulare]|nr:hypothetical protein MINTMi27_15470 [Mycobacterium intracellulare]
MINCEAAADFLEKRLDLLEHPEGVQKLVQFTHDSPGLRKVKRRLAESLVLTLERNGFVISRSDNA